MRIREIYESMDGVSSGTHMFTSEESRGSARAFGSEAMAGIKNKERILRAASFVTKQRNHPQNQARLVRRNPASAKGYEEVVTLSVDDTKLWAQKLRDFFKNPANNSRHKYLYYYLSDPTDPVKLQELVKLVSNSISEDQLDEKKRKRKKARRSVRGPVYYGGYGIFTGDSGEGEGGGVEESQLEEKWSEKYKRSINCSNPRGFSQRAHCQGRKKK